METSSKFQKLYKSKVSSDEAKKRRRDDVVRIRKVKQDSFLQKRRNVSFTEIHQPDSPYITMDERLAVCSSISSGIDCISQLHNVLDRLRQDDTLTVDTYGHILADTGILRQLVSFNLHMNGDISRIASSIVNLHSTPPTTRLASSRPSTTSPMQTITTLADLFCSKQFNRSSYHCIPFIDSFKLFCAESPAYRNTLLFNKQVSLPSVLPSMYQSLMEEGHEEILPRLFDLIAALFNDFDQFTPTSHCIKPLLPLIKAGLQYPSSSSVFESALQCCLVLTEHDISILSTTGIIEAIVTAVASINDLSAHALLIGTISNILQNSSEYTKSFIDASLLPKLMNGCFDAPDKNGILKDVCLLLSNICVENKERAQEVLESCVITAIVGVFDWASYDIRVEAFYVVHNCCSNLSLCAREKLVEAHLLQPLSDLLTIMEWQVVSDVLVTLEMLLSCGYMRALELGVGGEVGDNPVATEFEECDGVRRLEFLTESASPRVEMLASMLLATYFEECDEAEVPVTSAGPWTFCDESSESKPQPLLSCVPPLPSDALPVPAMTNRDTIDDCIDSVLRSAYSHGDASMDCSS